MENLLYVKEEEDLRLHFNSHTKLQDGMVVGGPAVHLKGQ